MNETDRLASDVRDAHKRIDRLDERVDELAAARKPEAHGWVRSLQLLATLLAALGAFLTPIIVALLAAPK